jgi:hypothetical protein
VTASEGLRRRSEAVRDFRRDEMKKHANTIRKGLIASAKTATGGDRKFSGLGDKPRISVSVRTEHGGRTTTVTIKPSPKAARGPWRWIEDGTKPGRRAVRPAFRNGRSRRAATIEGFAYYHPGTRGSQGVKAWSKPINEQLPEVTAEMRSNFRQIIKGG